jgi:hypothetical protein
VAFALESGCQDGHGGPVVLTPPLTAAEIAVVCSSGIDPLEEPTGHRDAEAELAELLDSALSVPEAADLLGCSSGEVGRRIAAWNLYGLRADTGWRMLAREEPPHRW